VPYFHVVYTLPSELRDIAYQNKRVVYDLLMKAAAETTLTIAADPKRLGARIGVTAVLHTWGSALTHHPHVHMIVPGGGLSLDSARWVAARADFLVHVNVLARLFRGKMLAMLMEAHDTNQLTFFNTHARLADKRTFKRFIAPLRRIKWVVYCKAPFAGPEQVLRYLSRYTHRVEEEPQHRHGRIDGWRLNAGLGQMQLERTQLFGRRSIGGPAQEGRQLLDSSDVVALRIGREPTQAHVVEHALAQRADGLLAHWGSCLEVGVLEPLDPQDGAPASSSVLNQRGYHPQSTPPVSCRLLPRERVRSLAPSGGWGTPGIPPLLRDNQTSGEPVATGALDSEADLRDQATSVRTAGR